jgi:lipooligosaccharide transport system ATP-binding protein
MNTSDSSLPNQVIEATGLIKRYRELTAVNGITFSVTKGELFGFLGPNGAGKTTTMKMVHVSLPGPEETENIRRGSGVFRKKISEENWCCPTGDKSRSRPVVFDNLVMYARFFDIPKSDAEKRA